jgi:DnaJ-class molecular chaperone
MPTLYEILEIDKSATLEEIRDAYKKLSLKWHPDKNSNSEESKIKFQKIKDAYEILIDVQKKNEYDELMGGNAQR